MLLTEDPLPVQIQKAKTEPIKNIELNFLRSYSEISPFQLFLFLTMILNLGAQFKNLDSTCESQMPQSFECLFKDIDILFVSMVATFLWRPSFSFFYFFFKITLLFSVIALRLFLNKEKVSVNII